MNQRSAIYPGTFDPITNGHIDIARRGARLFDKIYMAVATKTPKQTLFDIDERLSMAKAVFVDDEHIEVCRFDGLAVDFLAEKKSQAIIRGLRAVSDFDFEFQMAGMNRQLAAHVETIFLVTDEQLSFISSRLVREIVMLGGDVKQFVPLQVAAALATKIS